MKFSREIIEMLPCTGNVVAQFEQEDGEVEAVPVIAFARCVIYFNWDENEGCSGYCHDDDDEYCNCDEDDSEELVIPMVVMNGDDYVSFADEHDHYIGMKTV